MITPRDEALLRRAIELAASAVALGDEPYGSLLAGPDGRILVEAHNTVRRDRDIAAHPELTVARWAARELDPAAAAETTMYTSCEPCEMCAGGIARSGIGRVVFALSAEQFGRISPEQAWPEVPREGPALLDEARAPLDAYYRSLGRHDA